MQNLITLLCVFSFWPSGGGGSKSTQQCIENNHYPDPEDCTKFFHCAHGVQIPKVCAPGTVFNPISSVCDWPYNVPGCDKGGKPSGEGGSNSTQQCIENNHYPDPEDCTKFFHCAHGVQIPKVCAPGTVFNPISSVCDCPYNVPGCDTGGKPSGEGGSKSTQQCIENNHDPDPDDCTKFFHCAHGVQIPKVCAPGTVFNPISSVCDWPYNVPGCDTEGKPQPQYCIENYQIPLENDCTKYYRCTYGQLVPYRCPDDFVFNPRTRKCDVPRNVPECRAIIVKPQSCTENDLFPFENDNTRYYHCTNDKLVVKRCPDNSIFNPRTRKCDQPGTRRPSSLHQDCKDDTLKLVCYFTNWSQYRPGYGKFLPEDVDPHICTHIIFAFGWLKEGRLSSHDDNDETKPWKVGLYDGFNNLKKANPKLKTLLALGGYSFGSQRFKKMSATWQSRQTFISSAVPFLRNKGFDGLDIDWEYPDAADRNNYVSLLKELKDAFEVDAESLGKPRLLLTAAVPVGPDKVNGGGYNVPEISRYLDFLNIMAYDFHGKWERHTGHNAPLYAHSSDSGWHKQLSVDHAAKMWEQLGAPKDKLVIGMATYGRSFTLSNPGNFGVKAPTNGGGRAGEYTREQGFLAYYEVCKMLRSGAKYIWDDDMKVPYAVMGDQWVGFDDERSIRIKMKWLKDNGYAGAMVWAIDMDDFRGECSSTRYPLIGLMREELRGSQRCPKLYARGRKGSGLKQRRVLRGRSHKTMIFDRKPFQPNILYLIRLNT